MLEGIVVGVLATVIAALILGPEESWGRLKKTGRALHLGFDRVTGRDTIRCEECWSTSPETVLSGGSSSSHPDGFNVVVEFAQYRCRECGHQWRRETTAVVED